MTKYNISFQATALCRSRSPEVPHAELQLFYRLSFPIDANVRPDQPQEVQCNSSSLPILASVQQELPSIRMSLLFEAEPRALKFLNQFAVRKVSVK
jgi:hypothetical protein